MACLIGVCRRRATLLKEPCHTHADLVRGDTEGVGIHFLEKYRSDDTSYKIFLFVSVAVDGETYWGRPEFCFTRVLL